MKAPIQQGSETKTAIASNANSNGGAGDASCKPASAKQLLAQKHRITTRHIWNGNSQALSSMANSYLSKMIPETENEIKVIMKVWKENKWKYIQ